MDPINVTGVVIGVVGAIASAISSSNMFWTRRGERKVTDKAAGDSSLKETQDAKKALRWRGDVKDALSLVGTAAMVIGAFLAIPALFE